LNSTIEQVTAALEEYRLNEVAQALYHFFWDEFCDWYIEFTKTVLSSKEESEAVRAARSRIVYVLEISLRLLHPLMPFITEEIWQRLPHEGESIMIAEWPVAEAWREDQQAREQMETLIALITKVRNIRSEMNVPVQSRVKLYISASQEAVRALVSDSADLIKRLARVEEIFISDTIPPLESAPRDIVAGIEIAVPLEGLIDIAKEKERVTKEITRKENEARGLASRLANVSFVERAPGEVVEQTRQRHLELIGEIEKLKATSHTLGG